MFGYKRLARDLESEANRLHDELTRVRPLVREARGDAWQQKKRVAALEAFITGMLKEHPTNLASATALLDKGLPGDSVEGSIEFDYSQLDQGVLDINVNMKLVDNPHNPMRLTLHDVVTGVLAMPVRGTPWQDVSHREVFDRVHELGIGEPGDGQRVRDIMQSFSFAPYQHTLRCGETETRYRRDEARVSAAIAIGASMGSDGTFDAVAARKLYVEQGGLKAERAFPDGFKWGETGIRSFGFEHSGTKASTWHRVQ